MEGMCYEIRRAEACVDESAHHALVNAGGEMRVCEIRRGRRRLVVVYYYRVACVVGRLAVVSSLDQETLAHGEESELIVYSWAQGPCDTRDN